MNAYTQKNKDSQIKAAANTVSQKQSGRTPTLQLVDNRPEAVAQRKIQESISNISKPVQLLGKRTFSQAFGDDYESEYEPPRKKVKLSGIDRLHRSYLRNLHKKAKPVDERAVLNHQKLHNYGFDNKIINFGNVKGDFYKGPFGDQPYLRIDPADYGLDAKPKTNYDDIIKGLERYGDDAALATIIYNKIKLGTELPADMNATVKANASLLIQLTQFIEPHETRIPGVDKLARSFLKKIASGSMTFKQVFNRKDGLFVVARATGGGSKYGGQEAGRTLIGLPPKKSDKSQYHEIWKPEIDAAAADMSDSSDEEND
ncbi:hypothetical protein GWA97_08725 [Flavobacterium sp. LaA7.5]|nr:hypothetical protein [Flavobacterium salilacus subsp. altitudinum]